MLEVERMGRIQGYCFIEEMAIKEISRKLNFSRNGERKEIRRGHRYEHDRRSLPALGEPSERLTLRELKSHGMAGALEKKVN